MGFDKIYYTNSTQLDWPRSRVLLTLSNRLEVPGIRLLSMEVTPKIVNVDNISFRIEFKWKFPQCLVNMILYALVW